MSGLTIVVTAGSEAANIAAAVFLGVTAVIIVVAFAVAWWQDNKDER